MYDILYMVITFFKQNSYWIWHFGLFKNTLNCQKNRTTALIFTPIVDVFVESIYNINTALKSYRYDFSNQLGYDLGNEPTAWNNAILTSTFEVIKSS